VHACPMAGRKYVFSGNRTRITLEKQWHSIELKYPLQTVVADIDVHDAAGKQYSTIEVRGPSPSLLSYFLSVVSSVVEPKIFLSAPTQAPRSRKSELLLRIQPRIRIIILDTLKISKIPVPYINYLF
jgi:hypothetical protein